MKNEIKQLIQQALEQAYPDIKMPTINIEACESRFGDYSANTAMKISGEVGEEPEKIAQKIIDALGDIDAEKIIESAKLAGPGFINFKIAIPYLNKKILEIIEVGEEYGSSDLGKDLQVNIEFISANPTGPLTLGNGRGGFSGDVLANVFAKYGAKVTREYYLNDRGAQILALGHSVLKDEEAVYRGQYIDDVTSKIAAQNIETAGGEAAVIIAEEYIKPTIERMGIRFDHWFSEKEMFDSGKVRQMVEHLNEKKLTYEQDGAIWLKTTQFGDDKDRVLITQKGEHTYFASDIAYHYDKIGRGYDLLIDFWGADHHGYVGRMKAATEIIRAEENWSGELKIIISQLVRLMSQGQEVKMSKRLGTFVTLDELIDEVGVEVTRFFFLERSLDTHMDFDLDLAKERSQKNPVFYVQYAYARIQSILAKSEIRNSKPCLPAGRFETNSTLLSEPEEIELIKELMKLPEIVEEIVGDYQVQKLPFYARALADKFHRFYEKCPVLKAENEKVKEQRIRLLQATQIVLKNTLDLMGINAPEKM